MNSRVRGRCLDWLAGISLFLCGALVAWLALVFWLSALGWLATTWRITIIVTCGDISAVSAIALFFVPRIAGIIGSITLFLLACYFASVPPLKEQWGSALFAGVAAFVFWRFVCHRRAAAFI